MTECFKHESKNSQLVSDYDNGIVFTGQYIRDNITVR